MAKLPDKPQNRPKTGKKAPKTAFKPGQSGNPGGRPKRTPEEFELLAACERKTPEALATIVDLMMNSKMDSVRLAAANHIIERRYGKATERKEVLTGPLDGAKHHDLKRLYELLGDGSAGEGAAAGTQGRLTH